MGLKFFLMCLAVAASAAAVSDDDYDSYDGWWSQEVPSADLGIVDSAIDKLNDNDYYPLYASVELPDNPENQKNVDNIEPLIPAIDDLEEPKSSDQNISEENVVKDENTNDNLKLDDVLVELQRSLETNDALRDEDENATSNEDSEVETNDEKTNEEVADNFNDYLVEDNRSEERDEVSGNKDVLNNDDDSFKEFVDVDLGIYSSELEQNLENIEVEESPDIPIQIVEDAKKLLEEENGAYEEDIEETDYVLPEDKNESELDNSDDTIERLDDIFQSYVNEIENKSPEDNADESENNVDDNIEDITLLKKYENDMIDPDETVANNENINSSEQEDEDEDHGNDNDDDDDDDEDTVDKVYQDLNSDLDKLFATWDKLTADDSKLSSEETKEENNLSIEEYEEKYDRPYKEGAILSQRDNVNPEIYDDVVDSVMADDDKDSSKHLPDIVDLNRYLSQEEENLSKVDDEIINTDTNVNNSPIENKEDVSTMETLEDDNVEKEEEINEVQSEKLINDVLDKVTEKEYANLIYKFALDNHDQIEANVQDESVSPIYMSLEVDKAIEITSPNYPEAYPANNVVDWILEGEGMQGVELNITDLDLRGAQGDYLLINPGGVMDGQGLLFTYHLPAEENLRQYRFTSTNRVYIRFNAGAGLNFLTGFRLSVKAIWSSASSEDEDLPDPEALLPAPAATLTVNLGGLRYPYFVEVKDVFRRIIADMATMYINANRIDPGLNTTLETTQITNIASCNINWPSYDECVAVTFGVPLFYDVDLEHEARLDQNDLITMWTTYVQQDPFAARLRVLGITEFAVPNDNRVMMMWAVLGVGIFIAAIILGFALWRFSCFEGYSRMKEFDTDSLSQAKRGGLDLYPTPHQPLPPLYADNDYKWADSKYDDTTRVDLGGFANRSYARDELLEIDSDEDNIAPRDRYTTDV